jgi:hypothetical protein
MWREENKLLSSFMGNSVACNILFRDETYRVKLTKRRD